MAALPRPEFASRSEKVPERVQVEKVAGEARCGACCFLQLQAKLDAWIRAMAERSRSPGSSGSIISLSRVVLKMRRQSLSGCSSL